MIVCADQKCRPDACVQALMAILIAEIDCVSLVVCQSPRLTGLALVAMSIAEIDCVSLDGWIPAVDFCKPTWAVGGVVYL